MNDYWVNVNDRMDGMKGFFNLLLGMLDLPVLCWAVSTKPEYQSEMLEQDAMYGIKKENIADNIWKDLINILHSNTFENLLDNFLSEFVFPVEVRVVLCQDLAQIKMRSSAC